MQKHEIKLSKAEKERITKEIEKAFKIKMIFNKINIIFMFAMSFILYGLFKVLGERLDMEFISGELYIISFCIIVVFLHDHNENMFHKRLDEILTSNKELKEKLYNEYLKNNNQKNY